MATPTVTVATPEAPRGRPVDLRYRFAVSPTAPRFEEPYTVFVHALDERGTRVWTSDHQPPTPSTEWKPGSVVEYARPMTVPKRAPLGRVRIEVGLYSPGTGERLPLAGTDSGQRSYQVASLEVVRERPAQSDAAFLDGWYDAESPEEAQGADWRWSRRTATISARNPRRDAVLLVDADQPLRLTSSPQHVEIRAGAATIGTFTVVPGERSVRRLPVAAAHLGDTDVVRFTLVVDRTFVPAKLPGSSNPDTRELGIRVFSASLEPVADTPPGQ